MAAWIIIQWSNGHPLCYKDVTYLVDVTWTLQGRYIPCVGELVDEEAGGHLELGEHLERDWMSGGRVMTREMAIRPSFFIHLEVLEVRDILERMNPR